MSDDLKDCNPLAFGNDNSMFDTEIDEWLSETPEKKPKRRRNKKIENPLRYVSDPFVDTGQEESEETTNPLEEDEEMIVATIEPDEGYKDKPEVLLEHLSGIRTDRDGRTYRIAKLDGKVQRFYGDDSKNYKLKLQLEMK